MNENEITINNSDTDFVAWDMRRKPRKPAPGDWSNFIVADPFAEPGTAKVEPYRA